MQVALQFPQSLHHASIGRSRQRYGEAQGFGCGVVISHASRARHGFISGATFEFDKESIPVALAERAGLKFAEHGINHDSPLPGAPKPPHIPNHFTGAAQIAAHPHRHAQGSE
jgi:hypothetical protein